MDRRRPRKRKTKPRRPYGAANLRAWVSFLGGDEAIKRFEKWPRVEHIRKPEHDQSWFPP